MGLPILVTHHLPLVPSLEEDIIRMVRHGLSDILEALGEDVGLKPGEETHVVTATDIAETGETVIYVSKEYYDRIKGYVEENRPTFEEIRDRVKQANLENPFHPTSPLYKSAWT